MWIAPPLFKRRTTSNRNKRPNHTYEFQSQVGASYPNNSVDVGDFCHFNFVVEGQTMLLLGAVTTCSSTKKDWYSTSCMVDESCYFLLPSSELTLWNPLPLDLENDGDRVHNEYQPLRILDSSFVPLPVKWTTLDDTSENFPQMFSQTITYSCTEMTRAYVARSQVQ